MRLEYISISFGLSSLAYSLPQALWSGRSYPETQQVIQTGQANKGKSDLADFRELISEQRYISQAHPKGYEKPEFMVSDTFSGDGVPYSGIASFGHLDWTDCYSEVNDGTFDIGIVGMPFDLGVTYRPGARFGPGAVRMASRRILPEASWDMDHRNNPFRDWATVVDCGDVANTPFNKVEAVAQLTTGAKEILSRTAKSQANSSAVRMITIGGDHTITLPLLRATYPKWGPVAVLHFDSHLDTWDPRKMNGGEADKYSEITHGTMLHLAHEEGIISNNSNMHLGSRSMLFDKLGDLNNDARCGFDSIRAREIGSLGIDGVVQRVVDRVADQYVYVSIDIDVLDPAFAPATGTIEPGGWTTRELLLILQGLANAGVKIIGADIVELTPVYDNKAETSALLVVELVYELLQWMVSVPVQPHEDNKMC
ncbi:formiminoglutamate hydrolase [Aspergillus flavus]|nr:formiminoglutamate hydrolase [Aspergillus flavus]RAQ50218.1 formiminoglutamate hydrolase [Aspergillus flavus]